MNQEEYGNDNQDNQDNSDENNKSQAKIEARRDPFSGVSSSGIVLRSLT